MQRATMPRPSARVGASARAPATASASSPRPPASRTRAAAEAASSDHQYQHRHDRHQQQQLSPYRAAGGGAGRRAAAAAVAVAAASSADTFSAAANPPLPAPLQRIVSAFQAVPDPMARYKQLLFYAAKLPPLPADLRTPENKVEGCVSQVWVVAELRRADGGDGDKNADGNGGNGNGGSPAGGGGGYKVYWRADSDSQLTKGLAALLVGGLSGCSPEEILSVTPGFVEALGLKQSLTPSRNNGFLNMLRKMQRATLEAAAAAEREGEQAGAAGA